MYAPFFALDSDGSDIIVFPLAGAFLGAFQGKLQAKPKQSG
jgi:hypothetical protein